MASKKYKPNLKKKVREERAFQEKQNTLKEKYDIAQDTEVVVVEKSNVLKFLIRTLGAIIRLAAIITLITLAFVGVVALVYPQPRAALFEVMGTAVWELKNYLNV